MGVSRSTLEPVEIEVEVPVGAAAVKERDLVATMLMKDTLFPQNLYETI